jgi:translation initiation factor 2 subunit 3
LSSGKKLNKTEIESKKKTSKPIDGERKDEAAQNQIKKMKEEPRASQHIQKEDFKRKEEGKPYQNKQKEEMKRKEESKPIANRPKDEKKPDNAPIKAEKGQKSNQSSLPKSERKEEIPQKKTTVNILDENDEDEECLEFADDSQPIQESEFNPEEYLKQHSKEIDGACEMTMLPPENIPTNERKQYPTEPYKVKVGTGSNIPPNTQSQTNIGMIGHVDHGKTTLVKALTTIETDRFNEEKTRGITIRLGYAACTVMHCPKCGLYTSLEAAIRDKPKKWKRGNCPVCPDTELDFQRRISFVDCPGHETLMATMLGGASLMDAAILLVAANQKCPQPQTREHLAAITIAGIKKIIIVQNKIDSVSKQRVIENYTEIKKFVKGTIAENAPIIPVSAIFNANIDVLFQKIEELFPTPKFNENDNFEMRIVRSFDVNKPGSEISKLLGGVLGGTIFAGQIHKDEEIEIRPGIMVQKNKYVPIVTTVKSITEGNNFLDFATPGGLKALGTLLDPFYTKANSLIGSLIGRPGTLPDVKYEIEFNYYLFKRIVGAEKLMDVGDIKIGEELMLVIETMTTIGRVKSTKKGKLTCELLGRPICAKPNSLIAINKRFNRVFRLIGWGILK